MERSRINEEVQLKLAGNQLYLPGVSNGIVVL